jgi:hypothetical protein
MPIPPRLFLTASIVMFVAVAWPAEEVRGQAPGGQPQAARGLIAGQVVDSISGRAVQEATVRVTWRPSNPASIRGGILPLPVVVDTQGRFFFGALPPGLYTLTASKAGYLPSRAPLAVDLLDGERMIDLRLPLARAASLSGMLIDENGDPVVAMDVVAFRRSSVNGRPGLVPGGRGKSDDRGAYRIGGLMAGDYVVCACGRDPNPFDPVLLTTLAAEPVNLMSVAMRALTVGADVVSLDSTLRTYPPTLYPDSQTISRAQGLTLAAGEDKTAIDIRLALVQAARVSGRIVGAPRPLLADALRLVPAEDAMAGVDLLQIPPMLLQTDGRFDFASVPPGQYRLIVNQRETAPAAAGPSGIAMGFVGARGASPPPTSVPARGPGAPIEPPRWANDLITVPAGGITGVVVALRSATPLHGRVELSGSPPTPQTFANMSMTLQATMAGSSVAPTGVFARVNPDRTFVLPGVPPGQYFLSTPAGGPVTVESVTVGGVDVTDLPIEIGEQPVGEIVVSFSSERLASLSITSAGTSTARPPDSTAAVVFPADRKYWSVPSAAQRRLRAVQLTPRGSAKIIDLPAGDYNVAIASAQELLDWQDAGRLDALSRRAQRITLAAGAQATLAVRR